MEQYDDREINIFKTNINNRATATLFASRLKNYSSSLSVTFDLKDCDRVLRVIGHIPIETLYRIARSLDIIIEELPD